LIEIRSKNIPISGILLKEKTIKLQSIKVWLDLNAHPVGLDIDLKRGILQVLV
jgi:hypothetical protein